MFKRFRLLVEKGFFHLEKVPPLRILVVGVLCVCVVCRSKVEGVIETPHGTGPPRVNVGRTNAVEV